MRIDGLVDLGERIEETPGVPRLEGLMAGGPPFPENIRNLRGRDRRTIHRPNRQVMGQPIGDRFGLVGLDPTIQPTEPIPQLSDGTGRQMWAITVGVLGVLTADPYLTTEGEVVTDEDPRAGNKAGRVGLVVRITQSHHPTPKSAAPLPFVVTDRTPKYRAPSCLEACCSSSISNPVVQSWFSISLKGNRIRIVEIWRDSDTMRAVGRFIRLFRDNGLTAEEIAGDGGGLGIPICDRLAELGWAVRRVNNEAAAREAENFANLGTEIWIAGVRKIEKGEVILPDDKALSAQLTSRKAFTNSRGQIVLETKSQMRSRGLPSPDRAEAILGCLYQPKAERLLYG